MLNVFKYGISVDSTKHFGLYRQDLHIRNNVETQRAEKVDVHVPFDIPTTSPHVEVVVSEWKIDRLLLFWTNAAVPT